MLSYQINTWTFIILLITKLSLQSPHQQEQSAMQEPLTILNIFASTSPEKLPPSPMKDKYTIIPDYVEERSRALIRMAMGRLLTFKLDGSSSTKDRGDEQEHYACTKSEELIAAFTQILTQTNDTQEKAIAQKAADVTTIIAREAFNFLIPCPTTTDIDHMKKAAIYLTQITTANPNYHFGNTVKEAKCHAIKKAWKNTAIAQDSLYKSSPIDPIVQQALNLLITAINLLLETTELMLYANIATTYREKERALAKARLAITSAILQLANK